jgi:hypothetical protein
MKLNNRLSITIAICLLTCMNSCKKENGYGGNSAVKGVLKENRYNLNYSVVLETSTLSNTYVYIIFQDGKGYGDRVKTSFDGSFSFTHLKPGKYSIYAYSKDSTMQSTENIIVTTEFTISKKKELLDIGELTVANNNQIKGNAIIQGKVIATDLTYNSNYNASNRKVFLRRDGEVNYESSIYTNDEGYFLFSNIALGTYKIYTYSKDGTGNSNNINLPVEQDVLIEENNQNVVISDLHIYL